MNNYSQNVMPAAVQNMRVGVTWNLPWVGTMISVPKKGVMHLSGRRVEVDVVVSAMVDADFAKVFDVVAAYPDELANILQRVGEDAASVELTAGREIHDIAIDMLGYVQARLRGRASLGLASATFEAYRIAQGWAADVSESLATSVDVIIKFLGRIQVWNSSTRVLYNGADRTALLALMGHLWTRPSVSGLGVQKYVIAPALGTATYVHAATALTAGVQTVSTAITNPDVPRVVTVKGNVSGVAGNVVVTGTDIDDDVITNTIALSGTAEVSGTKAFKTVTSYTLPARVHVPVLQVETATAAGTITGSGNAALTVTAAGMTGSPKEISVAVLENDTAADWAAKMRTTLSEDAAVTALFDVSGATTAIVLTRKTAAANDATLNIAIDNGDCTGITPAPTSANTAQGVPADTVSVGVDDVFGMPEVIANAGYLLVKLFDGSTDAGSLAVSATRSQNLYTIAGTPNGAKELELIYLA